MNGIVKLIVLVIVSSGFPVAFNIQSADAVAHSFPTTVAASFVHDSDGRWRAYANVTVANDYTSNVTINWIQMNAVSITYIDNSFENLAISAGGNVTIGNTLAPGDFISGSWMMTTSGFSKEPKNLGVVVELSVQGFENQETPFIIVPEFPSFLPVLLIMGVALTALFLQKRKERRTCPCVVRKV